MGISVPVPENLLPSSPDESVELCIRPCFTGPFELPDQYESASPAYLIDHDKTIIDHDKTNFQKNITIRMQHCASLKNEKDCEDMAFATASSTPEYRGSKPVYTFKVIPAKGEFRPGDQVGQITLRLALCFNKIVKRIKEKVSSAGAEKENCLYSIRLYRNVAYKREVSAIFCICLLSPIYMKHCDKVMSECSGMTANVEGRSEVIAQIVEEMVKVNCTEKPGLAVTFDKKPTQILKRDVHLPEIMNVPVSELHDYPPRLLIYVKQTECSSSIISTEVQVTGLDIECSFFIASSSSQKQVEEVDETASPTSEQQNLQALFRSVGGRIIIDPGKRQSRTEIHNSVSHPHLTPPGNSHSPAHYTKPSTGTRESEPVNKPSESPATFEGITVTLGTLMLIKWKDPQGCEKIFRLVNKVSADWRKFGKLLKLEENVLDGWEEECLRKADRCWCKVMQHWLDNADEFSYPATWKGVLTLLEDAQYPEVAVQLERALTSLLSTLPPPVNYADVTTSHQTQ